jgi:hypothetical protein
MNSKKIQNFSYSIAIGGCFHFQKVCVQDYHRTNLRLQFSSHALTQLHNLCYIYHRELITSGRDKLDRLYVNFNLRGNDE